RDPAAGHAAVAADVAGVPLRLWIHNKADLLAAPLALGEDAIAVSAATGAGLAQLHERLSRIAGNVAGEAVEGEFSARARHVEALALT
ncbi:hypothetical protein SB822_58110, partial [Paraburkholderia sp. SIMBA_054]